MTCSDCGGKGHLIKDGVVTRCGCLVQRLHRSKLGPFYCETPVDSTTLTKHSRENLLLEGSLDTVRRHVSRVLLDLQADHQRVGYMDAYALIEAFLDEDDKTTHRGTLEHDLFILLLGFGDPPNKYLPHLILNVLNRRELISRPTWVVMGIARGQVAVKYNAELAEKLNEWRRARIE